MNRFLRILTLIILLLCSIGAYAQFQYFTTSNGLPSNMVNGLFQDSEGFIWAGTSAGLSYHNGKKFEPIESLSGKSVYSICEPADAGNLWVGTAEGLFLVNKESRTTTPIQIKTEEKTVSGIAVFRIMADREQHIWVGGYRSGGGLYGYSMESGTWKDYGLVGKTVRHILYGIDKSIWVCAGEGSIYRYNRARDDFDAIPIKDKFSSVQMDLAECACQDSNGDLWICSRGGRLFKLSLIDMQSVMFPMSFPGETVTPRTIVEQSPGNLIIGTNSGLVSFDTNNLTFDRMDKGDRSSSGRLNDRFIHSMYKDIDGGLWIGTYFGGVNYMPSGANIVEAVDPPPGCGNIISVMAESGDATVLVGSDDGGLSLYNTRTGNYSRADIDPKSRNLNIHAILSEYEDVWIGTFGNGLYRLDTKMKLKRHYTQEDIDKGDMNVYSAYRDGTGRLWIGTKNGIASYDKESDRFVRLLELEDNSDVTDITEFGNNIWFVSQGCGLIRYSVAEGSFEILSEKDNDAPRSLTCLIVYEGDLYAGGNSELVKVDLQGRITPIDGVLHKNSVVCGMMADYTGLWISAKDGLFCYEKGGKSSFFNSGNGLRNEQISQNSILRLSNGKMLVGTAGGLNSFRPAELKENIIRRPLKVSITEFAEIAPNGLRKRHPISNNVILEKANSSFAIDFSAINYQSKSTVLYKYRLAGHDPSWNIGTQEDLENGLIYSQLRPGFYTFEVAAAPSEHDEFGSLSKIGINIRPSVKSIIFFLVQGIIFLLLLCGLIASWMANKSFKVLRSQSIGLALGLNSLVLHKGPNGRNQTGSSLTHALKPSQEFRNMILLDISSGGGDKFVSGVCSYVLENLSNQNLSAEDIAREMNISRATVFNKIKTALGMTPNQMIKFIRLEKAADELCKYNVRVSDVLYSVGFESGSYFTKLFRNEFGITPKEFSRIYKDGKTWRNEILG